MHEDVALYHDHLMTTFSAPRAFCPHHATLKPERLRDIEC